MARKKSPLTRTRWYSAKRNKPTIPGVYEVEEQVSCSETRTYYAYWSGIRFKSRHASVDRAYMERWQNSANFGDMPLRWRGLKHKPATHPAPAEKYDQVSNYAVIY